LRTDRQTDICLNCVGCSTLPCVLPLGLQLRAGMLKGLAAVHRKWCATCQEACCWPAVPRQREARALDGSAVQRLSALHAEGPLPLISTRRGGRGAAMLPRVVFWSVSFVCCLRGNLLEAGADRESSLHLCLSVIYPCIHLCLAFRWLSHR
jgi:hypothetical protein